MRKFYVALIAILLFIKYDSKAIISIDSIGVENHNGKKLIQHKVEVKETYYSISRKYKVAVNEIIDFNNHILLKSGITIKVPTQIDFKEVGKKPQNNSTETYNTAQYINYTVVAKDYLHSIAKKFNTSVEKIKKDNNISNVNLKVGQVLKIETTNTPQTESASVAVDENSIYKKEVKENLKIKKINTDSIAYIENKNARKPIKNYGLSESEESGIAVLLNDSEISADKMFALHRSLPIGTIIKITNPITATSSFVKVVGKFNENETNDDAIIVITKAVADALNVQENRFFCHLTYAIVKNE
ncbi:MAG: LysM peptidoglycan-binding domain-containing protein [Sphingobacteriaceae bacterium]|nr:LysM peptidoglycan-binding domain-containing protein [Sphingobacteriaceae bacterium]